MNVKQVYGEWYDTVSDNEEKQLETIKQDTSFQLIHLHIAPFFFHQEVDAWEKQTRKADVFKIVMP